MTFIFLFLHAIPGTRLYHSQIVAEIVRKRVRLISPRDVIINVTIFIATALLAVIVIHIYMTHVTLYSCNIKDLVTLHIHSRGILFYNSISNPITPRKPFYE